MEAQALIGRFFASSRGEKCAFVAVSGNKRLRWILPARRPEISEVLDAWRPYGSISRIGWEAIRRATRLGALHLIPGAKGFEAELCVNDWRDFGWEGKKPPLVAMYVGTPGSQQKLVVLLADPATGLPRCVVKFPIGEAAWSSIEREYGVLHELKTEGWTTAPVPMVLDSQKRFAVQSWVAGRPESAGIGTQHIAFLASMAQPGKTIKLSEVYTGLWERHNELIKKGALSPEFAALAERLLEHSRWQGEVPAVRVHGDFAPWNLKRLQDSTICAIDWEESQTLGLPFYDLHYYQRQVERLLHCRLHIAWNEYGSAVFRAPISAEIVETASRAAMVSVILNFKRRYYESENKCPGRALADKI